MDTDRLVRAYVKMRDHKTAMVREHEAALKLHEEKMEKVEAALLGFLNANKVDSVATKHGTFYRQENLTPTGSDWGAFYNWVRENDAFEALERRIKKTFIKEYMDAHEGGVPPGVSVFREYVVRIRRGK